VFERIAQFPDGAQELEQRPGVRRAPLVRYPNVVYCERKDSEVTILRVLHGAQVQP
jgi:plasmid stabilization system protein ParE